MNHAACCLALAAICALTPVGAVRAAAALLARIPQQTTAPSSGSGGSSTSGATPAPASTGTTSSPPPVSSSAPPPQKANARPPQREQSTAEPFDKATVEKMAETCVKLETAVGVIDLEVFAEVAPETVRNFLNLAATGAYDTTTFSRVVRGFVIQGGNLTTREALTPALIDRLSRTIPDEPNLVKHTRGIVSMARSGQPNSATTNFFILVGDAPHLDGTFAAFGRVVRGMEIVDAINSAPADGEKPSRPVRLTRAVVAPCQSPSSAPR